MAQGHDRSRSSAGDILAIALALAALLGTAGLLHQVWLGIDHRVVLPWVPALGVEFAFKLDGLSRLFGLLVLGIGAVVLLYAKSYFRGAAMVDRTIILLGLFMLAMLGLILADDLITLFVFWELTTVFSFLLIGYAHHEAKARRAALMGLLVTSAGGLALLTGLILLGEIAGSYRISTILAAGDAIRTHPLYPVVLALVLVGAFTKSAQFPFHFWLPGAMAAPTPVSAYLHSATMVKAGVYLLARLAPVLDNTDVWFWSLGITGAVTTVWSALIALRQRDLKLMLAWTTVMGLGALVMFLGAGLDISVKAAMTFVLVHALYKCAGFLVVGNIDHATGTRDLDRLGGLWRTMPVTTVIAVLAAFSMAGFPPFLGSIGKELKYEGALAIAEEPFLFAAAAVASNAMGVSVALTLALTPFFGPARRYERRPHEASFTMVAMPAVLAVTGMVLGIDPDLVFVKLIGPAAAQVVGSPDPVVIPLEKGWGLPLILSFVTIAVGIALYLARRPFSRFMAFVARWLPLSGERGFDAVMAGLKAFAAWLTAILQNGSLTRYLAITLLVAVALPASGLLRTALPPLTLPDPLTLRWDIVAVVLLMAVASLVVVFAVSRLLAVCALGIVGYGTGFLFLVYGAVDVALTQLLVETLFVVIITAVLLRLPALGPEIRHGPGTALRNGVIAVAAGVVVTVLILVVAAHPVDRTVSSFFEQNSLPAAHGRNIVNVILVDFRALDTLGEIIVVAAAALGIWAMLGLRPRRPSQPLAGGSTP